MPETTWAIGGAHGRLLAGSRPAASFGAWTASVQPDGRWRIAVESVVPDPYWFENGASFRAMLAIGSSEVRGPAELVSREPLVFDMEIP